MPSLCPAAAFIATNGAGPVCETPIHSCIAEAKYLSYRPSFVTDHHYHYHFNLRLSEFRQALRLVTTSPVFYSDRIFLSNTWIYSLLLSRSNSSR